MKILAIDTSALPCSVAILEDDDLRASYTVDLKRTHSETLLPMIDSLFETTGIMKKEIDLIACASGPGSFTGLRIGAATAKGIGLALDKPIIPVPTLLSLSYNCCVSQMDIVPVMDARRGQVYTGIYRYERGSAALPDIIMEQCAIPVEKLIETINENGRSVLFLGDGVPVFKERIEGLIKPEHSFAPVFISRQRASALAEVSLLLYTEGRAVSADDFRLDYLRLSQAERERLERERQSASAPG